MVMLSLRCNVASTIMPSECPYTGFSITLHIKTHSVWQFAVEKQSGVTEPLCSAALGTHWLFFSTSKHLSRCPTLKHEKLPSSCLGLVTDRHSLYPLCLRRKKKKLNPTTLKSTVWHLAEQSEIQSLLSGMIDDLFPSDRISPFLPTPSLGLRVLLYICSQDFGPLRHFGCSHGSRGD